jgi:broad specificity phosphatase PhoE
MARPPIITVTDTSTYRSDDGCPIDAGGAARAESAADALPTADRVLVSPTDRCRETASGHGLAAVEEPELRGLDVAVGGAERSTRSAPQNRTRWSAG